MMSLVLAAAAAAEDAGYEAAKSGGLLGDSSFWVLIAFVIVLGVFARAGLHKTMNAR